MNERMFESREEFVAAMREACDSGFLTCTSGSVGDDGATYALATLPLDNPERFTASVREKHAQNMLKIAATRGNA